MAGTRSADEWRLRRQRFAMFTSRMDKPAIRIASAKDIPPAFGGLRLARKKSLVRMREPEGAETFTTPWGVLTARPGEDVVVIDASGSEAPVKKQIFERTYDEASHGEFRKHAISRLVQVPPGQTVVLATLEGDLEVRHPDYVVVGAEGEVYSNGADWVAQNLEFLV
jgi:hypothetical protein